MPLEPKDNPAPMPLVPDSERVPRMRRNENFVRANNGGAKFTDEEREFVLARVAELYLKGKTYRDIGADVGVSAPTVGDYLRELERRWRVQADIDFSLQRAKELQKLEQLEKTYWDAWERSLQETNKTVLEASPKSDGKMTATRQKVTRASTDGNSAFLEGVFKCIDRRIKLLGIDAAERYVLESRGETNDNALEARLAKYTNVFGVAIVGDSAAHALDDGARKPVDSERPAREAGGILDADFVERRNDP